MMIQSGGCGNFIFIFFTQLFEIEIITIVFLQDETMLKLIQAIIFLRFNLRWILYTILNMNMFLKLNRCTEVCTLERKVIKHFHYGCNVCALKMKNKRCTNEETEED